MKILQLCHKPPCPPKDGGCIAMNNLTQGLIKQDCEVKVLSIHTHKHDFEPQKLNAEYKKQTKIESIFVDTKINLVDAFSNLITQDSYNISRFFSADYDKKLRSIMQSNEFEVVLLESLFMTPYIETIRRYSKAKVILRSHNLEYIIWDRVAEGSRNPAKKTYLRMLAKQLKEYELNIFKNVDGIVAISSTDEKKYRQLGFKGNLITIPFGIDIENIKYQEYNGTDQIFHLGSMDWTPNIEGVEWFLTEVWPKVHKDNANVGLWLAGREMPKEMKMNKAPNVHVMGSVENAYTFMREKGIMIVPLLSAGGIRVKIIEGMALGIPIISTTIGAEGIDYVNNQDILIADTPKEFAKAIKRLTSDAAFAKSIGANARKLIEHQFDNKLLTTRLLNFFTSLKV